MSKTRRSDRTHRKPGLQDEVHRPGLVAVGRVVRALGLKGQILVEPLTDFPERFAPKQILLLQGQPHVIVSSRQQKGQWVLRLEGIDSRDQSEELRDELLYIPEGDLHPLPPGQYYRFQMLGLRVYTVGGVCLGQISEVLATGSNDVYVVTGAGGELLIPATTDVIQEVNLEGGRVVVDLPEASS